jgi:hypothetical protein
MNPENLPIPIPRVSLTFVEQLWIWAWNVINAAISGAATAGAVAIATPIFGTAAFSPHQLLLIASAGGATSAFNYVRENRLPAITFAAPAAAAVAPAAIDPGTK